MLTGRIKWFNSEKRFGFIICDDGAPDVFLYLDHWIPEGTEPLQGQRVEFETMVDRKGKIRAKHAWPEFASTTLRHKQ